MEVTTEATIRLEPEKARRVNTILDVFAQTIRGELQWTRRPRSAMPVFVDGLSPSLFPPFTEYEASVGTDKWVLTIFFIDASREISNRSEVRLTRLDDKGELITSMAGFAALSGLAITVQSAVEGSRAA